MITQNILNQITALQIIMYRFGIATLLLLPFVKFKKVIFMIKKTSILGFLIFISYYLQTLGLKYTTTGRSGFFTFLFAIFIPFLQYFLIKEKIKKHHFISLVIVLVGMLFLTKPGYSNINIGDVLTIICAFATALQIVLLNIYSSKHESTTLAFSQFLVVTILAGTISIYQNEAILFPVKDWIGILYLAVPATAWGILSQNLYQRYISATEAALIYALEPIIALLLGVVFLKESFGFIDFIGFLFVLLGVMYSELPIKSKTN